MAGTVLLRDMAQEHQKGGEPPSPIVAGTIDGVLQDLQTPVKDGQRVGFIRLHSSEGRRIYRRSVIFLLIIALHELRPEANVIVQYSASGGIYCDIELPDGEALDETMVAGIEARMRDIVAEDRPIIKKILSKEDAVQLFKQSHQIEKANLIRSLDHETVSIFYCGDFYDYLYSPMIGNTGFLGKFALEFYEPGVLLRTPEHSDEIPPAVHQPRLSYVLSEAKRWAKVLHCDYVTDLNRYVRHNELGEIIRVSEALQEKRIVEIANYIAGHSNRLRLVLIAGPSSSGKTSFAQRLRVQLRVNGLSPISISLDDYFVSRENTPRNEKGEYDFEALEALDLPLFNEHMLKLLQGESVTVPTYDFITGQRVWTKLPISIPEDEPIIIEGIHGLNERLSSAIPRENKYKIYVSSLTQLNIDSHNRIPTTDARLIRRLVRDHQFRGSGALKTLKQWTEVHLGEKKNIFPFQEEADAMFNSALIYELGVLKKYAVPLLAKVPPDVPESMRARRLLDLCGYFADIADEDDIPNNSILREFIGKSCFFR